MFAYVHDHLAAWTTQSLKWIAYPQHVHLRVLKNVGLMWLTRSSWTLFPTFQLARVLSTLLKTRWYERETVCKALRAIIYAPIATTSPGIFFANFPPFPYTTSSDNGMLSYICPFRSISCIFNEGETVRLHSHESIFREEVLLRSCKSVGNWPRLTILLRYSSLDLRLSKTLNSLRFLNVV